MNLSQQPFSRSTSLLRRKLRRSPPFDLLTARSAQIKIAQNSLDEVVAYAQSRLESARASFKSGIQEAKELQKELTELEMRVRTLKLKVRERWPVEYYTVRDEMDG